MKAATISFADAKTIRDTLNQLVAGIEARRDVFVAEYMSEANPYVYLGVRMNDNAGRVASDINYAAKVLKSSGFSVRKVGKGCLTGLRVR